jgi:hypothetical protein
MGHPWLVPSVGSSPYVVVLHTCAVLCCLVHTANLMYLCITCSALCFVRVH